MSIQEQMSFMTRFELTRNGLTPLLAILFAGAILILFAADATLIHSMIGDIIFLALFSGSFTLFARASSFKPLILNQNTMLAYPVMLVQQLPVTHKAIAYSRLIINNVYNILMQMCFILPYFIFVPALREQLTATSFIVFCTIWMSLGVFTSGSAANEDVGRTFKNRSRSGHIRFVTSLILLVGLFTFIHLGTPYTLIEGTIYIANTWPIIATVLALGFAYSGLIYGKQRIIRTLQTTDYI